MPKPRTNRVFRDAIAHAFEELLKQRQDLTQAAIARQLGVKRQAVNQWLHGQTAPSSHILAKAMQLWGLRISVDGHEFDQESFGLRESHVSRKPIQLTLHDLFTRPAEIEIPGGKLILRVAGKEAKSIEISVKLNLSA